MKRRSNQSPLPSAALAAAALTGGMFFSGEAEAVNFVIDGSFEAGGAWGTYTTYTHPYGGIQGVQDLGLLGTINYGFFDDIPIAAGTQFHGLGAGMQTVSLLSDPVTAQRIISGGAQFSYSSWLASWQGDNNMPALQLEFLDSGGGTLATHVLDRGVTTNQIATATGFPTIDATASTDPDFWALYEIRALVPALSTDAKISFVPGTGHADFGAQDWYADVVVLDIVPEPSRAALLGFGLMTALLRRRRPR